MIQYELTKETLKDGSHVKKYGKKWKSEIRQEIVVLSILIIGLIIRLDPELSLVFGLKMIAIVFVCFILFLAAFNIWDPIYVFKNRKYIGGTISLDVDHENLIQGYNENVVKIPFANGISVIVPPKGLIITVGSEEIHVPSTVSKFKIDAFVQKLKESNNHLIIETKQRNPLIMNSWSK